MVGRHHKPEDLTVPHVHEIVRASHAKIEHDRVKLFLCSGETAEILLYGATIISWKAGGEERLFLSEKAALDGSKAVRGGVPLVFPVFGKSSNHPTDKLPQHGFARTSRWEILDTATESEEFINVDFGLGPENLTVDTRKQWPFDFGLIYSVTLTKTSLQTKLLVRNEGQEPWEFNALFHTYLRVPDVTKVAVTGLKGVTYRDKVQGGAEATEESDKLTIASEVDRVYVKVPGTVKVEDIEVGKTLYTVERSNLDDVVVWNPWEKAKTIADFGPEDGYKNMLCVEAGSVSSWQPMEVGSFWEGGVTISI
ncbi:galactose mutarotase-like domain-containing protein [Sphaerosporella brunnea]|uniref:Glucose-6-phosphate 1-epimerase n=1 Tax=Sphaerosporella brunnea TaxID=1250544 RepID=A0A5J5ES46_9PEZI|nr:galactose mutarotase-like domain-containing protein [Sphaerosporella brunnea]